MYSTTPKDPYPYIDKHSNYVIKTGAGVFSCGGGSSGQYHFAPPLLKSDYNSPSAAHQLFQLEHEHTILLKRPSPRSVKNNNNNNNRLKDKVTISVDKCDKLSDEDDGDDKTVVTTKDCVNVSVDVVEEDGDLVIQNPATKGRRFPNDKPPTSTNLNLERVSSELSCLSSLSLSGPLKKSTKNRLLFRNSKNVQEVGDSQLFTGRGGSQSCLDRLGGRPTKATLSYPLDFRGSSRIIGRTASLDDVGSGSGVLINGNGNYFDPSAGGDKGRATTDNKKFQKGGTGLNDDLDLATCVNKTWNQKILRCFNLFKPKKDVLSKDIKLTSSNKNRKNKATQNLNLSTKITNHHQTTEVKLKPGLRRIMTESEFYLYELADSSEIFTTQDVKNLSKHFPPRVIGYSWELSFSTTKDGFSLHNLYRRMEDIDSPVIIVIEDIEKRVFGGVLSCSLRISENFYGNCDTFLFRCRPDFQVFKWSGDNFYFIQGQDSFLSVGSDDGRFGLWLDDNLYMGRTEACSTFNSPPLVAEKDFKIKTVECWTVEQLD